MVIVMRTMTSMMSIELNFLTPETGKSFVVLLRFVEVPCIWLVIFNLPTPAISTKAFI
jgi:hypothetical protein